MRQVRPPIEFNYHDIWVGCYWKYWRWRSEYVYRTTFPENQYIYESKNHGKHEHELEIFFCIIPMFPIHIRLNWYM